MAPPNNECSYEVINNVVAAPEGDLQQQQQQRAEEQQECQKSQMPWEGPAAQGLYDPQNEHEACGVGFIVSIEGKPNHKVSCCRAWRLTDCGHFAFASTYVQIFFFSCLL